MRKIHGVQVLLLTPMTKKGEIDRESTKSLIDHVIENRVHGIILLGSTGEFFSLTADERKEFSEFAVGYINERAPVGICTGHSGTLAAIDLTKHAEDIGADYVLVPIPYYFSNTMAGVIDHYVSIGKAVDIQIMPYDGGGGNVLDLEVWRRIVAATGNVTLAKITVRTPSKVKWLLEEFNGRVSPLGGSDQTILLCLAYGARGLTVAGANVVPEDFVRMFEAYQAGRKDDARRIYYEKIAAMNHIAVPVHTEFIQCYKQALYWQGIIASPYARRPMMPLDEYRKQELRGALEIMGVPLVR